jgi:hypothetical protein
VVGGAVDGAAVAGGLVGGDVDVGVGESVVDDPASSLDPVVTETVASVPSAVAELGPAPSSEPAHAAINNDATNAAPNGTRRLIRAAATLR